MRDRCRNGELTRHGLDSLRGRLEARLGWRAEPAIRPAVVIRKACGGNLTRKGADTQQVLSSVVRTARQRGLDLPALTAEISRAREPAVPDAFGLPPPPAYAGVTPALSLPETRPVPTARRRRAACAYSPALEARCPDGSETPLVGDLANHVHRPTADAPVACHVTHTNGGCRNHHEPQRVSRTQPRRGSKICCPSKVISARADPLNEYAPLGRARSALTLILNVAPRQSMAEL